MPLWGSNRFFETLREKGFSLRSKKLFKINDDVFLICLSSARMLFCVLVRSSKLGSLSPRIPLHPSSKDAQEYIISKNYSSWRIERLAVSDYILFLTSAFIHLLSNFILECYNIVLYLRLKESAGLNNFLRCDKRPRKRSFHGKGETEIRNQACLSAVALA